MLSPRKENSRDALFGRKGPVTGFARLPGRSLLTERP
jgi:hypothetical protein